MIMGFWGRWGSLRDRSKDMCDIPNVKEVRRNPDLVEIVWGVFWTLNITMIA